MKTILLALLVFVSLTASSRSEVLESAIVLQPGYVAGPADWQPEPEGPWPESGDPLWIVGLAREFHAPFDAILPGDGSFEVTYSFDGLSCDYTLYFEDWQCTAGVGAVFTGGKLQIFLDSTPDANIADPATFRDGILLLNADIQAELHLTVYLDLCPWENPGDTFYGSFGFTGGDWFDRVSTDGAGHMGVAHGSFTTDITASIRDLGYIGETFVVVDVHAPVATESSTWGKIKALYR